MNSDIVGYRFPARLALCAYGGSSTPGYFFILNVMLFSNPYTINTSIDDYTVLTPLSVSGYANRPLTATNWTRPTMDAITGITIAVYPTVTWTFTSGGQTIYGHAVYDTTASIFCWGANWPTPYLIPAVGGQVQLNISLTIGPCGSGSLAARSSRRVRPGRLQRST